MKVIALDTVGEPTLYFEKVKQFSFDIDAGFMVIDTKEFQQWVSLDTIIGFQVYDHKSELRGVK